MKINYLSALCGSGKTHSIRHRASELVQKGFNALIVQPTKDLINQTLDDLRDSETLAHKIHGDTLGQDGETVIASVVAYLKEPNPQPHVLLITWATFQALPFVANPGDWHVFIDEVPQVFEFIDTDAKESHKAISPYVKMIPDGPRYGRLRSVGTNAIEHATDWSKEKNLGDIQKLAKAAASGRHDVWVIQSQWNALIKGGHRLQAMTLLRADFLGKFASVTMAGALFEESPLFKIWSASGTKFVADEGLAESLRYRDHENGREVEILYAYGADWSKCRRLKNGVWTGLVSAIEREFRGEKYLWNANKDVEAGGEFDPGALDSGDLTARLPHVAHGMNSFQDFRNIAFLSALNLQPWQYRFLEGQGLSQDEVRTWTYRQQLYQAVMRTAIRNPADHERKRVIVPDLGTAEWLREVFPGSSIRSLGLESVQAGKACKKGRRRTHASNAAKTKACEEKRQREIFRRVFENIPHFVEEQFLDLETDSDSSQINSNREADNVLTYEIPLEKEKRKSAHAACLSIWGDFSLKSFSGNAYAVDFNDLIASLRNIHKQTVECKRENWLMSPGIFKSLTSKTANNVEYARVIILDIDGGSLSHKMLSVIFPFVEISAFNTHSNSKSMQKWRAIIPLTRPITAIEYNQIAKAIVRIIEAKGFVSLKHAKGSKYERTHGIDHKVNASDMFYMPCQAKGGAADSFFQHYKKGRKAIDPDEWLANHPIEIEEFIEAGEIGAAIGDVDNIPAVKTAIDEFMSEGTGPGQGDAAMYVLAMKLRSAGLSWADARPILHQCALGANSPSDRLRQARRLERLWSGPQSVDSAATSSTGAYAR